MHLYLQTNGGKCSLCSPSQGRSGRREPGAHPGAYPGKEAAPPPWHNGVEKHLLPCFPSLVGFPLCMREVLVLLWVPWARCLGPHMQLLATGHRSRQVNESAPSPKKIDKDIQPSLLIFSAPQAPERLLAFSTFLSSAAPR